MISRRGALIAIALTCAAGPVARAADDAIIGIWCQPKRNRHGPLGEWSLTGDDEAIFTRGGRLDTTYEIAGDKIRTATGVEPEGAGPTVLTFRIDGDVLVIDRSMKYGRLRGPFPGAHPLVGEWSITHKNGQRAQLRFSRTGALQLFFPQSHPKATSYRRKGNHITIEGDAAAFDYDAQRQALVDSAGELWRRFTF
jgi:hypothetical protein